MRYKLLANLKKDGKFYNAGQTIELEKDEAKELRGILKKAKKEKKK